MQSEAHPWPLRRHQWGRGSVVLPRYLNRVLGTLVLAQCICRPVYLYCLLHLCTLATAIDHPGMRCAQQAAGTSADRNAGT